MRNTYTPPHSRRLDRAYRPWPRSGSPLQRILLVLILGGWLAAGVAVGLASGIPERFPASLDGACVPR